MILAQMETWRRRECNEEQYSRKLRSTFKIAKEENITVSYLHTTISNMIRIGKLKVH
jgi:hypothetical protein